VNYATLRLPVLEARMDWITATAKQGERANALTWYVDDLVSDNERHGDRLEPWNAMGYRGFQCGLARYGRGSEGAIAVVSGPAAQDHAVPLAQLGDHWTRVDYCVTCLDEAGQIDPTEDYWEQWDATKGQGRIVYSCGRTQNKGGGNTLTLGSRASAYYSRVYDKGVESKGSYPKGSWRWETELKRQASEMHRAHWLQGMISQKAIAGLIKSEFARLHLDVPWDAEPEIDRAHHVKHPRDAERIISWLSSQVAPSVAFAIEARGVEAVLEALNLPHISYEGR